MTKASCLYALLYQEEVNSASPTEQKDPVKVLESQDFFRCREQIRNLISQKKREKKVLLQPSQSDSMSISHVQDVRVDYPQLTLLAGTWYHVKWEFERPSSVNSALSKTGLQIALGSSR
jgi:hypothetical protein